MPEGVRVRSGAACGGGAAIGWTTDHCYEIRTRDDAWGIPNDILATAIRLGMPNGIFAEAMRSGALYGSNNGLLDARKARLIDVIERAGTKTVNLQAVPH
jgi:hypothetical protein